jgi:ATP-dependent DNA helicase Rep
MGSEMGKEGFATRMVRHGGKSIRKLQPQASPCVLAVVSWDRRMPHPLNPSQARAVNHQDGPLLVLAGAGSGKTRVITHRIARLLENGIPARAIVALTFTNKAAGEMRERIAHQLGPSGKVTANALTISTFHSFGLGVLTREKTALGGTFTIFDQGDAIGAVKEILRKIDAGKPFDASAVLTRISNAKNAFISPEQFEEHEGDGYDEIAKEAYPRYVEALRGYRAFDFDDLVCEVAHLWTKRADVRQRWQERFRYVMVDEYQDTNRAQLELLRLLAAGHRNICVVGDDDQAIYGWRGADVRNILQFEEHFPGAQVVKLEQNYRSRAPILAVANAVIAKRLDGKYKKVLFTHKAGGDKVQAAVAPTPDVEAGWVSREIKRRHVEDKKTFREIAVLYRSNGQSKLMEEALREQAVPHRVLGGQQFFERKEVKDVLSYLKVVLNPADEISLRRVINYPARGIGSTSVERLGLQAVAKGWTLWQAVERADAIDEVSAAACEGCRALEKIVDQTRQDLTTMPPSAAVRALVERIGLREDLDASSPSPKAAGKRWENVAGLFASFARKEAREPSKPSASWLAAFLHALTLDTSEEDAEEPGERVTLSTLHGSKGLEFDVVYLLGCEEGLLPHARTLDARATDAAPQRTSDGEKTAGPADIEEERRLFYVGVTRARESLVLTRCRSRVLRGKPVPRAPSRFLADIPAELVEEREVRDAPAATIASMGESANALLAALDALGR